MNGLQYRMLLVIASRRVEKSVLLISGQILLTMKDVVDLIGELLGTLLVYSILLCHGAEIAQYQL